MKLCAVLISFFAASASAITFSLNPSEDAFVSAANPNSNYGGAGALAVSASGLAKGEFDSLLKFDLSGAKASFDASFGAGLWTIDSITLQLTTGTPNNAIFNTNTAGLFSINWMQNDSWVEGTGTPMIPGATGVMFSNYTSFLSASDEALGTYSFGGGTTGNNTWNLGLTSAFTTDVTAGNVVSVNMTAANSAVSYVSNSHSFTTVASRPVLTVSTVAAPEPGTGALLVGAAMVCLARRGTHARTA